MPQNDPSTAIYTPPAPPEQQPRPPRQAPPPKRSLTPILGGVVLCVLAVVFVWLTRDPPDEPAVAQTRQNVPFVESDDTPPTQTEPSSPDDTADPSICGAKATPGLLTHRAMQPITWNVHVPAGYTGKERVPLIVLLAGRLNARTNFLAESGFGEVADREGFVVATPVLRDSRRLGWEDSVSAEYVTQVVEELGDEVCVDTDHVFIYAEGEMASKVRWLGCRDWVAGIATHHGRPKRLDCKQRQIPYLHLSPTDSSFLPLDGTRDCMGAATSDALSVEAHDELWRKVNGCSATHELSEPHENVTCHHYAGCDEPFSSCRTAGGYGWAGSGVRALYTMVCQDEPDPRPAPIAEIAWEFFQSATPALRKRTGSAGCGKPSGSVGLTQVTSHSGLTRTSSVAYIPEDYDPNRAYPVLLLLHRDAQTGKQVVQMTKFAELAEEKDFIILAPEDEEGGIYAWRRAKTDVDLVRTSLATASEELCIDTERVFAVGHSSAGHAIEHLSCEPWVTAVAMNSFRTETPTHVCDHAVPSIHLSPMNSRRMLVQGGKDCMVVAQPLSLVIHESKWAAASGCQNKVAQRTRHGDGRCMTYAGCRAPFVSCHLDGGYGWPGSNAPPPDPMGTCRDAPLPSFPAEEVIWDFFEGLPR